MGQTQSGDAEAGGPPAPDTSSQQRRQVGWPPSGRKAAINGEGGRNEGAGPRRPHANGMEAVEHVRKLSIVSNRNIQLLSMKPRSERDNYADGLRSRRRSSLINMILGAPSSGPRFSDDLCSLNSHMSELCQNFGIDYFPDSAGAQLGNYNNFSASSANINSKAIGGGGGGGSTTSSLVRLEDGAYYASHYTKPVPKPSAPKYLDCGRRRSSSFGSLTSLRDDDDDDDDDDDKTSNAPQARQGTSKSKCSAVATPKTTGSQALNSSVVGSDDTEAHYDRVLDDGDTTTPTNQSDQTAGAPLGHPAGRRRSSLSSMFLASIDLTSSLDEAGGNSSPQQLQQQQDGNPLARHVQGRSTCTFSRNHPCGNGRRAPPLVSRSGPAVQQPRDSAGVHGASGCFKVDNERQSASATGVAAEGLASKKRVNQITAKRILHRSGSELSLYSSTGSVSSCSLSHYRFFQINNNNNNSYQLHHNCVPTASSLLQNRRVSRLSRDSSMIVDGCCGLGRVADSGKKLPAHQSKSVEQANALLCETKLIIMLQVCLPFILAGFGNMAAGLVLSRVAQWQSFQHMPIFFVLLPSFVGLKGNIEMTLASRLSTLANLNLLVSSYQRRRAYLSNLVLIMSQAIGLSIFAAFSSMLCEFSMGKFDFSLGETFRVTALIVLPCALVTSMVLVFISSIVMWWSIWFANLIQVNPDNLSTLLAAMYGDVTCVLTYGLFAEIMYSFHQRGVLIWPIAIVCIAAVSWPILWYMAFKFRETRELALSSMPPMLTGIVVSLGSGTVLSLVVGRYSRIALYQPLVNGFGANLIAVQASRVSTWLWCTAIRRLSSGEGGLGATRSEHTIEARQSILQPGAMGKASKKIGASLVSFTEPPPLSKQRKIANAIKESKDPANRTHRLLLSGLTRVARLLLGVIKTLLWSFLNPSPNSVAARLLLIMLVPAQTLYFFVIWLLSPANYVVLTWPFYTMYIALCLTQVSILLLICEPLMTLLMRRHLDPDVFGISLLMALADLVGTLCLTGAFWLLARMGDPNAS